MYRLFCQANNALVIKTIPQKVKAFGEFTNKGSSAISPNIMRKNQDRHCWVWKCLMPAQNREREAMQQTMPDTLTDEKKT